MQSGKEMVHLNYENMKGVVKNIHGFEADNRLYATTQTFKKYYYMSDSAAVRAINKFNNVKKITKKSPDNGKVTTVNAIPIEDFIMDYALYTIDQEKPDTDDIEAEHEDDIKTLKGTFDTKKIPVKVLLSKLVDEHFETIKLMDELDGLKQSIVVQKLQEFDHHNPQFVKGPAYNEYKQWLDAHQKSEPDDNRLRNIAKQSKPNQN